MPDDFGPSLEPVTGGEFTEQARGKFRPSMSMPSDEAIKADEAKVASPDFSELEKAVRTIESYLDKGHPFSNREIDVGARLIMSKLSGEERTWIREIADRIHKRPLWHCFAGWFRYCQENGMANAPVFDSRWDTQSSDQAGAMNCIVCKNPFQPKIYGQAICSNRCGAELDKQKISERIAKQEKPQVTV